MRRTQHWAVSVGAVILAMMAIQMSSLGFSPLLPDIRKELAASYSQMGLFTGMYGLIAIFISLPAGILAARFGEKRMLLTGLGVTAIGLASLGFAHSYGFALVSRALWLVGYRFAFICVFTAMAMGTPEKYRSRTMGFLGAMAALASVIGAPFGTRLAEWVGWRGGIFGFAVIALLGGALFAGLYHPAATGSAPAKGAHGHAFTPQSLAALLNPVMWGLIFLGLVNMGGFSATFFVPCAVESVFGLNARASAAIISSSYLFAIFLNLAVGWLCDRYSRWNIMVVLAALLIPASFAVLSHDLIVFRIGIVLVVSLGHAATNQIYAICGSVLTRAEIGTGMGIVGLGSGIFGYLGPQMLGYLRDSTGGFTAGWVFVAVAAVVSLAACSFFAPGAHARAPLNLRPSELSVSPMTAIGAPSACSRMMISSFSTTSISNSPQCEMRLQGAAARILRSSRRWRSRLNSGKLIDLSTMNPSLLSAVRIAFGLLFIQHGAVCGAGAFNLDNLRSERAVKRP